MSATGTTHVKQTSPGCPLQLGEHKALAVRPRNRLGLVTRPPADLDAREGGTRTRRSPRRPRPSAAPLPRRQHRWQKFLAKRNGSQGYKQMRPETCGKVRVPQLPEPSCPLTRGSLPSYVELPETSPYVGLHYVGCRRAIAGDRVLWFKCGQPVDTMNPQLDVVVRQLGTDCPRAPSPQPPPRDTVKSAPSRLNPRTTLSLNLTEL